MGWGGARRGAGRPRLSDAAHRLRGAKTRPGPRTIGSTALALPAASAPVVEQEPVVVPPHLSAASARFFSHVSKNYRLEPHHVELLTHACEALDLSRRCRRLTGKGNLVVRQPSGRVAASPVVAIGASARREFAALISQLELDADAAPTAEVNLW